MKAILVSSALLFASSAAMAANPAGEMFNAPLENEPIMTLGLEMDPGINEFTIDFEEPIESTNLTFWYERTARCSGLTVHNLDVRFNDPSREEPVEWANVGANKFRGVFYYGVGEPVNQMKIALSADRRLIGIECLMTVSRNDGTVPEVVTRVVRVDLEACANPDDGDVCAVYGQRVDDDTREELAFDLEEATAFGLQQDSIYELTGFYNEDGLFDIESARKIWGQ